MLPPRIGPRFLAHNTPARRRTFAHRVMDAIILRNISRHPTGSGLFGLPAYPAPCPVCKGRGRATTTARETKTPSGCPSGDVLPSKFSPSRLLALGPVMRRPSQRLGATDDGAEGKSGVARLPRSGAQLPRNQAPCSWFADSRAPHMRRLSRRKPSQDGHRQATELAIAMTNRDVGRGNRPSPTLCVSGRKGRPKPLSIRILGFFALRPQKV